MTKDIILKFIQGKTNQTEDQQIKDWLADPSNEKVARQILGEIWTYRSFSMKNTKPDFDQILNQIHHNINLKQTLQSPYSIKKTRHKVTPLFYRVAAILILPLLISSLILTHLLIKDIEPNQLIAERQIHTKQGTVTHINLPDGTKVWLNDGTTLSYPEKFNKKERRVYIDGEAYFKVKTDPEHPFIVENSMMNTIVTGTSFNINAYNIDQYFELTLSEGKVNLTNRTNQNIKVNPGEQIIYDVLKEQISKKKVNPKMYSSWIDGKLIIDNEPLNIAIRKLSRWYNVTFIIEDAELNKYLLTATFENEKLEQALQNIAYALSIKYSVETDTTDISKRTIYIMKK